MRHIPWTTWQLDGAGDYLVGEHDGDQDEEDVVGHEQTSQWLRKPWCVKLKKNIDR